MVAGDFEKSEPELRRPARRILSGRAVHSEYPDQDEKADLDYEGHGHDCDSEKHITYRERGHGAPRTLRSPEAQ